MKNCPTKRKLLLAAASAQLAGMLCAEPLISDLKAEYRNGQVFLVWHEENLPPDARLSVWCSEKPLTAENVLPQKPAAALLNPGSSTDWWCDPASFVRPRSQELKSEEIFAGSAADEKMKIKQRSGFVIAEGGKKLAPGNGLHVHTVKKTGKAFFAVGWFKKGEKKPEQVICLKQAIPVRKAPPCPIALSGRAPKAGSGKKRPLIVELHGRGGGMGVDGKGKPVGNFIFYADETLAWRDGIPYKFEVRLTPSSVRLILKDRTWIGRPLTPQESPDVRDCVPAINSFWLGYNRNIGVSNQGPEYLFDNYTERLVIYLVRWAQKHFDCDRNRTYLSGGSMGGTGSVQLATHYPELFAAVRAFVPVYSYTWRKSPDGKPGPSATRLVCSCGYFTERNPARMPDGTDLLEYASGEKNIAQSAVDIPPIFASNGRNDMSIPWVNNPPFYRAAGKARQAFCVFWNDGDHGMSSALPADMRYPDAMLFQYRLDQTYPAFSQCSSNRNYGNGDPRDGDAVGWINRGMNWKLVSDTPQRFSMALGTAYPGIVYPVKCTVTFRRIQQFKPIPGEQLSLSIDGRETAYTVPADGLLSIPLSFAGEKPVAVEFRR